jgi:hypothetical protein
MGRNVFLKALIWVPLLGGVSLAMPSSNNDLNLRSILPLNDLLIPRSEPLEIRGVYGGKKRRYIILPRASSTCCKKPKCKATIGEFLDENCKCAKCKAGTFPSIDGLLCTDKCPQGKSSARSLLEVAYMLNQWMER